MYDDWAYRAETTTQPTLKPTSPTRPRARSLLQSVAIDGEDIKNKRTENGKIAISIPSRASVPIRRARSLTRDRKGHRGIDKHTICYPFTQNDLFQLNNLSEFLDANDNYEIEIENALNDYLHGSSIRSISNDDLSTANLYPYLSFIQASYLHSNSSNKLIKTCDSIIDYLDELSNGFRNVRIETNEFESACHSLISEQTHLSTLSKDVETNLEIFTTLERAMRVLHSPGSDLPGKSSFKSLLADLDRGLDYFDKNPNILDMDLYQMRYRQCLTRALTLAVEYFNNRLNNNTQSIEAKINQNKSLNPTAHSALIYASFESDSYKLKDIGNEVFLRTINNKEYSTLYDGCLYTYFGLRKKLLTPIINKNFVESGVGSLANSSASFVQACRTNLSFFQEEIYSQELTLFESFFTCPLEIFENWLIDLSEPLYDILRQKIIREHNIDNLCELTSLLLSYKEEEDDFFATASSSDLDNKRRLNISSLFQPILEDVQSRLVFRVQSSVEQDIVKYTAKTTDIVTLGGRRKSSLTPAASASSTPQATPTPPILSKEKEPKFNTDEILRDLYPPMRKAVSLLARIYQLVNSKVFDDLAHTIVHESLLAIKRASPLASARLGAIEGDLFIVKNLLMLQSQVSEYEIDNVAAEIGVDFSGLQEVFGKIRQEGVSFASSNLLNLARASVPKVVNNMLDAKEELYAELRNSIHDLTQHSVTTVAQAIVNQSDPSSALEDTRKLRQDATVELPRIRSMIENYITDERTIDVLMDSVQDLVIQTYEAYHQQIVSKAKKPQEIDGLMEVDALVSWLGDIVGKLHSTSTNRKLSVISR